jgi:hypothetical protein
MAATAVTLGYTPEKGINYTYVTDSSADWAAVPNSTYFYDKTDKLPHYKDSTGAILEVFSSGAASGRFGISDSNGAYTYYSTLTSAMTAAVSGQTIEVFADYTETGAVTITLKNGVTINGNGHTYTLTTNSGTAFDIANSVSTVAGIFNLNVVCSGTASSSLYLSVNTSGTLTLTGSIFRNTSTGTCISNFANSDVEVLDFKGFSNSGNCVSWASSPLGKLRNSYCYSASGIAYFGNIRVDNCIAISGTNIGLYCQANTVSDSIGISSGSFGIQSIAGVLNNCKGYSSANTGIYALYCNIYGCFGYSTASAGIILDNSPTNAYDCFGYSTASYGITSSGGALKYMYNCTALADASAGMLLANASTTNNAIGCTVVSKWNNAAGHGIIVNGANNVIMNCSIEVANASANALNASSAQTVKYANNAFNGPTTPINANITQGIVNTQDNQGNILV